MADNSILQRLDGLKLKYEELGQKLTDPCLLYTSDAADD